MFLLLLDLVANSPLLLTILLVAQWYAFYVMQNLVRVMHASYGGLPDAWIMYEPDQLATWLHELDADGCEAYLRVASWDLVPFMELYTIILGSLLLQQTRAAGFSDDIAMIFPVVLVMDAIETVIPAWGCQRKPLPLPQYWLLAAAAANKFKWVLTGTGLAVLSVLFVYNSLPSGGGGAVPAAPTTASSTAAATTSVPPAKNRRAHPSSKKKK